MVGLVMVVVWCLSMMRVVRLRVDRAMVGLSMACWVNIVRIHRVVIMRVLVRSSLLDIVVNSSSIDAVLKSTMVTTVRVGLFGRERVVNGMLVVMDGLHITLIVVVMVKLTVSWVIS